MVDAGLTLPAGVRHNTVLSSLKHTDQDLPHTHCVFTVKSTHTPLLLKFLLLCDESQIVNLKDLWL